MVKYPDELATVVRVSPDAWFFIVTLAFGTTAPVESSTVPVSVPVNCWPKQSDASRTLINRAVPIAALFHSTTIRLDVICAAPFSFRLRIIANLGYP